MSSPSQDAISNKTNIKALEILNEREGMNIPQTDIYILDQGQYQYCAGCAVPGELSKKFWAIRKELNAEKKKTKEAKMLKEGWETCHRCGGTGNYSWNQKDGSMCYGCMGKGIVPIKKQKSKGKGWSERPDVSGKAPEHVIASNRDKTDKVLRTPMKLKEIAQIEDIDQTNKFLNGETDELIINDEAIALRIKYYAGEFIFVTKEKSPQQLISLYNGLREQQEKDEILYSGGSISLGLQNGHIVVKDIEVEIKKHLKAVESHHLNLSIGMHYAISEALKSIKKGTVN